MLKSSFKYISLLAASLLLSMTTVVLGALPMRVMRRLHGRLPYWIGFTLSSAALAAAGLSAYGLLVFAMAVAVGIYTEIEEHGGSVFTSAAVAILAAMGTTSLGVGAWVYRLNGHLLEEARNQVAPLVERLSAMNAGATVSVESLIQQLPSGVMIGFMIALAIAVIGEARVMSWFSHQKLDEKTEILGDSDRVVVREDGETKLSDFRVPDSLTWLVILAIFGSFFQHGIEFVEAVSLNILNVLIVVYFFQGLAVVSQVFRVYKISPFWQSLWYIVLVLQLFIVVSFLGLADYWLEFRERLARKTTETNKNFLK